MQLNYQQCWCFAVSGARQYAPEIGINPGLLRRTLRHVGGQIIVLALVLLDIGGLGVALIAPIWLTPWVAINVTALVLASLSWSEDWRIQRESATATRRQQELQRDAERQQQTRLREAEQHQRREEQEEREAQKRLQAALRQAQQHLREAEQRRYHQEKERETQKQQSEKAERLRQAEQRQKEGEQKRQAEEQREAQREGQRGRRAATAQFDTDWWVVLGVAPSASKDEIVSKYRHKIKKCHPDRLLGLAPELLHLAEEQTKALNGAYANAMRTRRHTPRNAAAA